MTPHFKLHPDDEGVDHIEIDVVPRYKTSGLSGDEWRVSARLRMYRKGTLVGEQVLTSMEAMANALPWFWLTKSDWCEGPLYDGERGGRCQQAGCKAQATVLYQLKQEWSARGEGPLPPSPLGPSRRQFCAAHAVRGDAALEDADDNYELIQGRPPTARDIPPEAVSPARTLEVKVDRVEDVPGAVKAAVDKIREERRHQE